MLTQKYYLSLLIIHEFLTTCTSNKEILDRTLVDILYRAVVILLNCFYIKEFSLNIFRFNTVLKDKHDSNAQQIKKKKVN